MVKSKQIGFRTKEKMKRELEKLAKEEKRNKSEEARLIFLKGLKERKKELAIEKYVRGGVTLERAAEIADVSVWKMVEILKEKEIPYNLDIKAIKEELKSTT